MSDTTEIKTMVEDEPPDSPMFRVEPAEVAGEHFRQALGLLGKLGVSPAPLYYTLLYNYIAGTSTRLNRELDELTGEGGTLDRGQATVLFQRFFSTSGDAMAEAIRGELVTMVAQVVGALVDIAGKTSLANEVIAEQIDRLAVTSNPTEVISAANVILGETRQFVTSSRGFESELLSSAEEMHRLKEELSNARREAAVDSLTGLYNRRAFDRRLEELMEAAIGIEDGFCLLLLDIDHFKRINDSYGHIVGDKVLTEFAKQIGRLTRRSDFVVRYGGEEFAILLPNTRITSGFTVAENVRATLERVHLRRMNTGEALGSVTVSLGVACYRLGESKEGLIARCDQALYRAKRLGRNRTVLAD